MNLKNILIYSSNIDLSTEIIRVTSHDDSYRTEPCSNAFQFGNLTKNGGNFYFAVITTADTLLSTSNYINFLDNFKSKNPFTKIIVVSDDMNPIIQGLIEENKVNEVVFSNDINSIASVLEKNSPYTMNKSNEVKINGLNDLGIRPQIDNNTQRSDNMAFNQNVNAQTPLSQIAQPQQMPMGYSQGPQMMPNNTQFVQAPVMPQSTPQMPQNPIQYQQNNMYPQPNLMPYQQGSASPMQKSNPYQQNVPQFQQAPQKNNPSMMNGQNMNNIPQMNNQPMQTASPMQNNQPMMNTANNPQYAQNMPQYPQSEVQQQNNNFQPYQNFGNGFNQGVVIAVHSPKGGVGKTTISKELAAYYASLGHKVCLVDMDIEYGDIATMIDLQPVKTMVQWAKNISRQMAANSSVSPEALEFAWEEIENHYLLKHSSGVYVLAAPTNHRDTSHIGEIEAKVMLVNLKKQFDIVIVDTGPNIKDVTFMALEYADQFVLVSNSDIATLQDIDQLSKTLNAINFSREKIRVIMNQTSREQEDGARKTMAMLNFPNVVGIIPKTTNVSKANDEGSLLVNDKNSVFTAALKKIADILVPPSAIRGGRTVEEKKSGGGLIDAIKNALKNKK